MSYSKLKEIIENSSKISFIEYRIKLIKYINKLEQGSDKNILEIKLKYFYDPPELLVDPDIDLRNHFINNPDHMHAIFNSIYYRIKIIEEIKAALRDRNEEIEEILNGLSDGYINSIDDFVNFSSSGSNIFNQKILIITQDLQFREISIEKAYEICSYEKEKLNFVKRNINGLSYGKEVGGIYYKSDYGFEGTNKLYLRPLMEFTIKEFYSSVLNFNKFDIISPTQLIILWDLPIFNDKSNEKKEYDSIKSKFGIKCDKEMLEILPFLKSTLKNGFTIKRPMILQANLYQKGDTLNGLVGYGSETSVSSIREFHDKLDELIKSKDFMYSYSGHIISALLLLTSDAKQDNFILNENSKLIIGIDNDRFMDQEIEQSKDKKDIKLYLKFKNVLFTIQKLMQEQLNVEVRESILKINPYQLVLGWLIQIFNQEKLYNEMLEKCSFIDSNNNNNNSDINKTTNHDLNNSKESVEINRLKLKIKLPFKIQKDSIQSILDRFNIIKRTLNQNLNVTHSRLFQEVLPLSHHFYECISNIHKSPIEQLAKIYDKDINSYPRPDYINTIISNYDFNSRKNKLSIQDTIRKFISSLNINELLSLDYRSTFLEIVKYIIDISKKGILDEKQVFDNSWYTSINEWVLQIIYDCREDEIQNTMIQMFQILKINSGHLNNSRNVPIVYQIVEKVKRDERKDITSKIVLSILILKSYGTNIDNLYRDYSPLDLIIENRNKEIFEVLVSNGASIVRQNNISDYYESLGLEEKVELSSIFNQLSSVNSQISWTLPFDHLFEKTVLNSSNSSLQNTLYYINGNSIDSRIVSTEYSNDLIQDSLHQIHLKFSPEIASNHMIYNLVYKHLFETNLQFSEFGILNGEPVLLRQSISGTTLKDISNSSLLSSISESSISKLIIMEILFFRINGGLDKFIIDSKNNILPIENENSFLPLSSYKNDTSILPDTCVFLLDQMNNKVSDDVKKLITGKHIMNQLKSILKELQTMHNNWISLFNKHKNNFINRELLNNIKERNQSVLGVLFYKNQIVKLYSRLVHLQNILKSNNVTHLTLLKELLNPFVESRYSNILDSKDYDTLEERYEALKSTNQNQLNQLKILGIQDVNSINASFERNENEPANALELLQEIEKKEKLIEPLFFDQLQYKINSKKEIMNIKRVDDSTIEYFLKQQKRHQDNSSDKQQYIIDLLIQCSIQKKNLRFIKLKNNNQLQTHHLHQILGSSIINLNISNCNNSEFTSFSQKILLFENSIKLNSATKIKLNSNCNLISIKLIANNLKSFSSSGNIKLEELELQAPKLNYLDLSNKTLNSKSKVFEKNFNYKELKSIEISNNNKMDFMFKKEFNLWFNELLRNYTKVIYDKSIYNIVILDTYHVNYRDDQTINQNIYNEEDTAIKVLTGYSFKKDRKNQSIKENFNKLYNYKDNIVHVDYRFNYAFEENKNILFGVYIFNPTHFSEIILRNAYLNGNRNNEPPFILLGISKHPGDDYSIQRLENLKQICNNKVIYKFNVTTSKDEEEITNQLLNCITNFSSNNNIDNDNEEETYNNYSNSNNNNNNDNNNNNNNINNNERYSIINNYINENNSKNNNIIISNYNPL